MQWNQIPKIPVTPKRATTATPKRTTAATPKRTTAAAPKRTTAATPRKPATPPRAGRIMVTVVDRNGKRLGEVPKSTTSVGAGKIAGGEVVFSRRWDITKGIGGKGRMTIRRTGNRWQAVVDG